MTTSFGCIDDAAIAALFAAAAAAAAVLGVAACAAAACAAAATAATAFEFCNIFGWVFCANACLGQAVSAAAAGLSFSSWLGVAVELKMLLLANV